MEAAVDQDASAKTMTSGSASTTFSQATLSQPLGRFAKMLVAPTVSRMICGPPPPVPANSSLSPESYHSTFLPLPAACCFSSASFAFCSSISLVARSSTRKMRAMSVASPQTASMVAGVSVLPCSSQPNGLR